MATLNNRTERNRSGSIVSSKKIDLKIGFILKNGVFDYKILYLQKNIAEFMYIYIRTSSA